jgi:hypothetical protein
MFLEGNPTLLWLILGMCRFLQCVVLYMLQAMIPPLDLSSPIPLKLLTQLVGTMESVGFFTVPVTYPSFPHPLRDIFMALT